MCVCVCICACAQLGLDESDDDDDDEDGGGDSSAGRHSAKRRRTDDSGGVDGDEARGSSTGADRRGTAFGTRLVGRDGKELAAHMYVYRFFKQLLRLWEADLASRSDSAKGSTQGSLAALTHKQCKDYMRPFFKMLKANVSVRRVSDRGVCVCVCVSRLRPRLRLRVCARLPRLCHVRCVCPTLCTAPPQPPTTTVCAQPSPLSPHARACIHSRRRPVQQLAADILAKVRLIVEHLESREYVKVSVCTACVVSSIWAALVLVAFLAVPCVCT